MQSQSGLRARLQTPFFQSLGILIVALFPRLAALGRYVTPDEPIWVYRSIGFREALLAGDWAATLQSGHPGVTLTWLGTLSIQLQLWLQPQSREHLTWLDQLYWLSPENGPAFQHLATFLTAARLGPIILTSLGIVAIYWLLRAQFGRPTAEMAALLLIIDPFTAGLSGLFHLDALLSTLMLLAVLVLLPKSEQLSTAITRRQAILSGTFTALAVLTKTPGLFLLPFIFLIILWRTLSYMPSNLPLSTRLRQLPPPLFLWAGTVLVVIVLLLPAVWVAPLTVIETISGLANRLADDAVRPIFFLGQETLNPGPAFYPLVLVFRLSPVVCIGLFLSAVFVLKKLFRGRSDKSLKSTLVEQFTKFPNAHLTWLLLFSLGFLFFLNLSAKRFDRYALPAIMSLILISAVGLKATADRIKNPKVSPYTPFAFITIHIFFLFAYQAFPLTAYNWLAGGPDIAEKVFTVGWGEKTSDLAKDLALINSFSEHDNHTLYTSNIPAAAAFYPGPLLPLNAETLTRLQVKDFVHFLPQDWQAADPAEQDLTTFTAAKQYLIQQRGITDLTKGRLFTFLEPADFNLPTFQSAPQQIHFAEQIAIRSAGALPATWPNPILVGIQWERLQTAASNHFYRLELVDQSGEIWLTHENPLLNAVDHSVQYWAANEPQEVFYNLFPLSDLTPGTYTIQATLFDEQGARLGVFTNDGRFAGVTAPLATLSIPAPPDQLPPDPPNPIDAGAELIGHDPLPTTIETGLPLKIDLWWRQMPATPQSGTLRLFVGSETADYNLSTTGWAVGQYYRIRPIWRVPVSLNSGTYPLTIQWLDENGRPQWPAPIELGQIEIVARPRSFDLPPDITPLQIQLGTVALLQEADPEVTDGLINLTVIWQAIEPDGVFYTTFVHLLDEAGNTVTQGDRPSLEPTHTWVSGQIIREQYQLTRPPSGQYTIIIGLYQQTNGLRLPVYSADGNLLPNEQYMIEVMVP